MRRHRGTGGDNEGQILFLLCSLFVWLLVVVEEEGGCLFGLKGMLEAESGFDCAFTHPGPWARPRPAGPGLGRGGKPR